MLSLKFIFISIQYLFDLFFGGEINCNRNTTKYYRIPENATKCFRILQITTKKLQITTKNYKNIKISENIKEKHKMQQNISNTTRYFKKLQNTTRYYKISQITKTCYKKCYKIWQITTKSMRSMRKSIWPQIFCWCEVIVLFLFCLKNELIYSVCLWSRKMT